MLNKNIFFHEAIKLATESSIRNNKKVLLMGLGVDDPKGVFGTTLGIHKKYKNQVFDLPTAENAFTGFALGLAISGFKPIIVHQRVEFSLLSIEQIFNQISKWHFMSGGKISVPLVIRLIVGKGWGQGPQHSQSLETIYAHIPGLKVLAPTNPDNAYWLLKESIKDPNPVIFFEHRWLHGTYGKIKKNNNYKIGKSITEKKGNDITLISFSYSVLECIKAAEFMKKNYKIHCEILNLLSLKPLDKIKIKNVAKKNKNILIVDNGMTEYGVSAEIIASINNNNNIIERIGVLNAPIPSTVSLAKHYYPEAHKICQKIIEMLKIKPKVKLKELIRENPDQPDQNFTGPF
jgi:acetoin:2,6-dichlorophenolindophenol oxidoreductase subunit beta